MHPIDPTLHPSQSYEVDPKEYKLSTSAVRRRKESLQSAHKDEVHVEVEKALKAAGILPPSSSHSVTFSSR